MILSTVLSNWSQKDNWIGSGKQKTTTIKVKHSNLNADVSRSEAENSYGFCVHIDCVFMGFIGTL